MLQHARTHKRTHTCAHTCMYTRTSSITCKHTHAHTIMYVNSLSVVSFVICFFNNWRIRIIIINFKIIFTILTFELKIDTLWTCFQPLSPLFCCSSVFYIQVCPFELIIMYLSVSEQNLKKPDVWGNFPGHRVTKQVIFYHFCPWLPHSVLISCPCTPTHPQNPMCTH